MSDQCRNCTVRGNIQACETTPCNHHESWIDLVRIKRIRELEEEIKLLQSLVMPTEDETCEICGCDTAANVSICDECIKTTLRK